MPLSTSAFDLPDHLVRKSDPVLIADDERHFASIAESLEHSIAELSDSLDKARKAPGRPGQEALERDAEVRRITARLRALRRFGLALCLGRIVLAGSPEPMYIGRLGLTDSAGRRLLVDWRSPAAEPFFGATHAQAMGVASRRRYRWNRGRVSDYWDEAFTPEGLEGQAALEDLSAFIASLGSSRSDRMRDVLGTIAAEQDAVTRASSRGTLVVDGGPGTGKTVVALHRAAYLLYSDPRFGHRSTRSSSHVLLVGPHRRFLAYVADVLPSLGEEGVQMCTLRDLVPEGATAVVESDPQVAGLKSSADLVNAIEAAVRFYEEPPAMDVEVETPYGDFLLGARDWADAFAAPSPGTPHNEARDEVWEELLGILMDRHQDTYDGDDATTAMLRTALARNTELTAWTVSDLPLLDAARQRLGDPESSRRKRLHNAAIASERELMDRVVEDLVAADDSELLVMSMLCGQDMQEKLVDYDALPQAEPDQLAGPFAHIIVDEAQELTDAQWRMLLLRCPSRSFTVVGDRAQSRHGFAESWQERLGRIGMPAVTVAPLGVNYRTPSEIMAEAEHVIRAALPDANVPSSIRSSGIPVLHAAASDLEQVLDDWLSTHTEGTACVISATPSGFDSVRGIPRVSVLSPEESKGLEFDLVVLVDPEAFGAGIEGTVDRYVGMTRATRQLAVLTP
ncbi:HelD family protein [Arthrobacter sp. NyZ413]|uniref:HelD family protein n=1 Tax=Arthrobacter sp. NyZ413 TaxID=3144669 RepID=UPI003BF8A0C5